MGSILLCGQGVKTIHVQPWPYISLYIAVGAAGSTRVVVNYNGELCCSIRVYKGSVLGI